MADLMKNVLPLLINKLKSKQQDEKNIGTKEVSLHKLAFNLYKSLFMPRIFSYVIFLNIFGASLSKA